MSAMFPVGWLSLAWLHVCGSNSVILRAISVLPH